MEDAELKVSGYTFKLKHLLFAAPIFSALSGGTYYSYDVINRFIGVEAGFEEIVGANNRLQALEQTVLENDVSGLNTKLSQISTQMATILEQQRELLDLRSQVERSSTITDGLGNKLDVYDTEIDNIWDAMDELYKNPLK